MPPSVPTTQQISSVTQAIAATAAMGIDAAGMVALLDFHIAQAVEKGQLRVSYQGNGRSVTVSLEQAQQMRDYYQRQVEKQTLKAAPPVIPMTVEFL